MKYLKTLITAPTLAVALGGLVTANTASAEYYKEFGEQAYAYTTEERGDLEMFAQSNTVATDTNETWRGQRRPDPRRNVEGRLPGR